MTPLHWAIEKKFKAIVRILLKHDADVLGVSKFGRTPIGLAVLTEQADILEDLQNAKQKQITHMLQVCDYKNYLHLRIESDRKYFRY